MFPSVNFQKRKNNYQNQEWNNTYSLFYYQLNKYLVI